MITNIPRKITNGMWVASTVNSVRRVGIITQIDAVAQTATLSLVDDAGLTTARLPGEPLAGMEQAKFDDIPEPRRNLEREAFAALGYV